MSDTPGHALPSAVCAVSGDDVVREVERIRDAAERGVIGACVAPHLIDAVCAGLMVHGWQVLAHVDGALSLSR